MLSKMVGFVVTTNADKARAFYGDVLGFRFERDDGFALAFDANGTALRVVKAKEHTAPQGTVLGWEVDDIERAVDDLVGRGAMALRVDGLGQDARGIWDSGAGKIWWFKDPDGNTLSLTELAGSR